MIKQKGIISVTITFICLTSIFFCSTTLVIAADEKGEAFIDNLVCTKEGDIIIIYHRRYWPSDISEESGPHVRVLRVSEENTFQTIASGMSAPFSSWGLVQEDNNAFRLIGWDGAEWWWFKDNHSSKTYPGVSHPGCGNVLFPRQVRHTQKLQEYTLMGWCENEPRVIVTNGTTTDFQNMTQGVNFTVNAAFIAINSSEAYYSHVISGTSDLLIRHLTSNMTILNEITFTISGTPFRNISCSDALLGLNGDPYVGVRILDPNWETPLDTYQHTFELVNLKKNGSFVLSIPTKTNYYNWNGLVDESGIFHGFFPTEKDGVRYVRVTSDGNIEVDFTFTSGGINTITFWGSNHIIGEVNNKLFLLELSTATVIISNTEVVPFISYYVGMSFIYYFIFFLYIFFISLFVFVIIIIIRFWLRRISRVEVPAGKMTIGSGGPKICPQCRFSNLNTSSKCSNCGFLFQHSE
ncbi:MAG: hypothetical protein ACFFDT_16855 [Candidatus Hodarchaeota archaeon]